MIQVLFLFDSIIMIDFLPLLFITGEEISHVIRKEERVRKYTAERRLHITQLKHPFPLSLKKILFHRTVQHISPVLFYTYASLIIFK